MAEPTNFPQSSKCCKTISGRLGEPEKDNGRMTSTEAEIGRKVTWQRLAELWISVINLGTALERRKDLQNKLWKRLQMSQGSTADPQKIQKPDRGKSQGIEWREVTLAIKKLPEDVTGRGSSDVWSNDIDGIASRPCSQSDQKSANQSLVKR
jgi:hypothetical protein